MRRDVRLTLAVAAALLLQLPAWTAVTRDGAALVAGVLGVLAVLGAGLIARVVRAPEWAVSLAKVVALAVGTLAGALVLAPGVGLADLIVDTATYLATSVAPVQPHAGLTVAMFFLTGLLALLAETLAVTLDQAGWVVLPLLVLVLVPALGPRIAEFTGLSLVTFAVGLVLVLAADGVPSARPAGTPARPRAAVLAGVALTTALSVGVTAAVAPLVPVPVTNHRRGNELIRMSDPSIDLKRNLVRAENRPAFRYTTDGPDGVYLRLTSLPSFDANGWRLADSEVRTGSLPNPPGLTRPGDARRTTVTIQGLESEYLPLPYAPRSYRAGEDWGYLEDSLTVLALSGPERQSATAGLTYEATSVDVRPSDADLAAVPAGARPPEGDLTSEVPGDVPAPIVELTDEVIAGASGPGERAQAILSYLQGSEFTYSLRPAPGSGYETLERFLLRDKTGYCEQYAASMALMARIAGIPSRVAVGFTPGQRDGDAWQVTMHDMHTWPELYFEGWGWVAFEPTPGDALNGTGPSPTPSASPTATPTQTPTSEPSAEPTTAPEEQPPDATPPPPSDSGPAGWLVPVVALAALLVAASPALVRALVRRRRLNPALPAREAPIAAWDEVRASFLDHGHPWPAGSPRYAAAAVASRLPEDAHEPLRRLALDAEAALFDRPADGSVRPGIAEDVAAVRRGLDAEASGSQRVRATLWPLSLWRR
ncbi:transglutaminase family protein [Nigerium massiliense]|uniref:transglutaminase family protein n=1 Tax=Nigerium massiliense TaxID=1522317 RepID=UPI000A76240B|nr:DUF3488 and transglutaminase-like domain-containing protein [Nigerium massiliense]